MSCKNFCMFVGKLVDDPKLNTLEIQSQDNDNSNSVDVINFRLLVSDRITTSSGKKLNENAIIYCEAWHTAAKYIAEHCRKGDYLLVESRLKQSVANSDDSGKKFNRYKFRVESFDVLGRYNGQAN